MSNAGLACDAALFVLRSWGVSSAMLWRTDWLEAIEFARWVAAN